MSKIIKGIIALFVVLGTATITHASEFTIQGAPYTTFNLNNATLNMPGTVTVYGTATVSSGTINVGGNWRGTSTFFNAGAGSVVFTGSGTTNQTLTGSSTFYNLTSTRAGNQLNFEAGKRQTISNTLTLNGASGNNLVLRSTESGTQWEIDPQGTRDVSYVDVKDSKNVNSTAISASNSTNSGNNTNWSIPSDGGAGGGDPTTLTLSITSKNPSDGTTDVSASTTVSATFSLTMNGSTLDTDTFKVSTGGSAVSGSVTTDDNVATFTPSSNLSNETTYTATITTGAQAANNAGTTLSSDESWSFTTETATSTPTPTATVTVTPEATTTVTPAVSVTATPGAVASPTPVATPSPTTEGVTGSVHVDNTTPDINDLITFTVTDSNLNTYTSGTETVSADSSLWGGTTFNQRGDHLLVVDYSQSLGQISLSHPDGYAIGTQSIRVSSTDNNYVWMVPTSLEGVFRSPLETGNITFPLGTQTDSEVPLVRGSSSDAESFLSAATKSSFAATLDGLDNTLELSPDNTHWVSVPVVETSANSGTFVGTVGFDFTAARLTTDANDSITDLISDSTETTLIQFPDEDSLQSFIGTGSVVRIFDGTFEEYAEVTSVGTTHLVTTKLDYSLEYTPEKTWIQVIGNDMMPERMDTNDNGTELFRIGGYHKATYRVRYNDARGFNDKYLGGDTLAVTTSNMNFNTYTGDISIDVTDGITGIETFVAVTLTDQDLNISNKSKQSTFEKDNAAASQLFWNENGIGLPSAPSSDNESIGFKNGATAKIVYASTISTIPDASVNLSDGGNTVDFALTETVKDSGTFRGSFFITADTATSNAADTLNVSGGDVLYVHYNDSPGETSADNSDEYTASNPVVVLKTLGVLNLSKDTMYLSGDTIVATVVDSDRNTSGINPDVLTGALQLNGSNYTPDSDLLLDMLENGVNTGTFFATIQTGETTSGEANIGTIQTVQDGIADVVYTDTNPGSATVTKQVTFSAFDATLALDADSYVLDTYARIILADAERNEDYAQADVLGEDVTVSTSEINTAKVLMTETGVDTGTFIGSVLIASFGGTVDLDRIQAEEGETLTVSYTDEENTTGDSRHLTDTAAVVVAPTLTPTPTVVPTATAVTSGSIEGNVVDADTTSPIENAAVVAIGTAFQSPVTTDSDGFYQITGLPAGTYIVIANAAGYTTGTETDVTVAAGETVTVNFSLTSVVIPTPTPEITPSPTPTAECPDPAETEAEAIDADPEELTISKKDKEYITITITNSEGCPAEGVKVKVKIKSGENKIKIKSDDKKKTDENGQAVFTLKAKRGSESAEIKFKTKNTEEKLKTTVTVNLTE